MIFVLLPVFLLTGTVFGVAAHFFAAYVFDLTPLRIAKLCIWNAVGLFAMPPLYFGVYMLASPRNPADPPVTPDAALIPAAWLFTLLLGTLIGLWRAWARRRRHLPS